MCPRTRWSKLVSKFMNVTKDLHGQKFFVRLPHPETQKMVICSPRRCSWRWS